jgi:hypothetical protein
MARLVKEWMKAKKGICSSDCECLTITGWRCYAEEHLCNCGDWGSTPPVPPEPSYSYSVGKTTDTSELETVTYSLTRTRTNTRSGVDFLWIQMFGYFNVESEIYPEQFIASNDSNFHNGLKCLWDYDDRYEWYEKFEQAIAWEITAEELWNEFSAYYSSMPSINIGYETYIASDNEYAAVHRWIIGEESEEYESCFNYEDDFSLYPKGEFSMESAKLYWWTTSATGANLEDAECDRLMALAIEAEWDASKSESLYYEMERVYNEYWEEHPYDPGI